MHSIGLRMCSWELKIKTDLKFPVKGCTKVNMLFFFVLLFCVTAYGETELQVTIPNGVLRGHITKTRNTDHEFVAFEGIPYARPPIGKYRFKEPKPVKPWLGVWEANKLHTCMQYHHYHFGSDKDMVIGDEDCLYVNVYKPKGILTELLDVIVFIHGGAFMFGGGRYYGPHILLDRKVIYVSINYRLGPLGFLSTEDSVLPGNLGMKDQVLALKWIKENIQYFNGNPNSITLTGLSAGGASVHLHLMSPLSKGLFNRAISMSGNALDSWVLAEGSSEKTKIIAGNLGCPTDDNQIMIDCLRYRPARQIVDTVGLLQPWLYNPFSPLGIVIDKAAREPFLPEHPYKLLEQKMVNDVPWILSHTNSEGLYPAADFMGDPKYLPELEQNWNKFLPYILHYDATIDKNLQDGVSQKIKEHYLKGQPVSVDNYPAVVQLISDRLFVADSETAAKMQAAAMKSPVYYYYYKYRGAHSMSELMSKNNINYGAAHADDTSMILSTRVETLTTSNDRQMSNIMIDMWMTFSKYNIPIVKNVEWKPISKTANDLLSYLEITSPEDIKMTNESHFKNHQFWESLRFNELKNLLSPVKEEL